MTISDSTSTTHAARISTVDTFDADLVQSGRPVLVDFWAPWCGPCKVLGPIVESLAQREHTTLDVLKVDIDEGPEIAARFGIRSIPTLILFKNGQPVATQVGAVSRQKLDAWVAEHI